MGTHQYLDSPFVNLSFP